jgi:hypothetical protein
MPDYTMRPKRQVPQKAVVRKFVSITPMKDDEGLFLQLRRYKEKENVGEAVLHMEPGTQPAEVSKLVEEFRNL